MRRFSRVCAVALILALSLQGEGTARVKKTVAKSRTPAATTAYIAEQPAYGGMRFHVYKPANIPSGWYVTYDGYPVSKGRDGVWYYGTREGAGITQTGYVVGSVVPSMVNLKQWTVATAPVAPIYQQKPGAGVAEAHLPGWARNSAFMAVEKWRGSVDRIGVINKPSVPVAWKGERPKVIYVWTGSRWSQIMRDGNAIDEPLSELRRNMYGLTVTANRSNAAPWGYDDMALLSQYAALWGYRWMGHIPLVDQYGRPGVPYQY